MPYIPREPIVLEPALVAGELNRNLAIVIDRYLKDAGCKYQQFNDIHGALSLLDFEVKRRFVAVYEDTKLEENGDVFTFKGAHHGEEHRTHA